MANYLADTQVERVEAGRWRAALSPDWAVWGPNGGYVAAIALRAALGESRLARPASFACHFLAVGEFAPVELRVASLGGSKRAESLRVDVVQNGKALLAATVWTVDGGLAGYEHDFAKAPEVAKPAALRGYHELAGDEYAEWYPIWRSIEGRPLAWNQPPGEPVWRTWLRFTDTQPQNTWSVAAPREYGFYANVNPEVDHPRWSQATERRIGDLTRRKTLPFNGYAEAVASLYSGMDLRANF